MLIRKASVCIILCVAVLCSSAQLSLIKEINQATNASVALAPLHFLASDELMGRATLRPEIHIAARYISEQFRVFGIQEMPSTQDYFQTFELKIITPPTSGSLTIGNKAYQLGSNLLQARGTPISLTAHVVYAGFGSAADLANINVQGKIVVTNMGK